MKNKFKILISIATFCIMMFLSGAIFNSNVKAKVNVATLNKSNISVQKDGKYTLKIKNIRSRFIRKITFFDVDKKYIKVKIMPGKKRQILVKGIKKINATKFKVKIKFKKKINGKLSVKRKCKVAVKVKANKRIQNSNGISVEEIDTVNLDYNTPIEEAIKIYNSTGYINYVKVNNYLYHDTEMPESYLLNLGPDLDSAQVVFEDEYQFIMSEVRKIVKNSKITDDMTDQEKVYRAGRYIIDTIEYDYSTHEQSIYGTLKNKKTVCAGYSSTLSLVLRYLGIDCDFVWSNWETDGHAWNYVKLGKYYYVVDLTVAYGRKNWQKGGILAFFNSIEKIEGTKSLLYIGPIYNSEEYKKTHPVDTINYYMRCKQEGIAYISSDDLVNRYEESMK